jgi:hypothetical protein
MQAGLVSIAQLKANDQGFGYAGQSILRGDLTNVTATTTNGDNPLLWMIDDDVSAFGCTVTLPSGKLVCDNHLPPAVLLAEEAPAVLLSAVLASDSVAIAGIDAAWFAAAAKKPITNNVINGACNQRVHPTLYASDQEFSAAIRKLLPRPEDTLALRSRTVKNFHGAKKPEDVEFATQPPPALRRKRKRQEGE